MLYIYIYIYVHVFPHLFTCLFIFSLYIHTYIHTYMHTHEQTIMGTRGMDTTGREERCDAVARESAGDELASEIDFHGLPLQGLVMYFHIFPAM